jgi:hypothetical protein
MEQPSKLNFDANGRASFAAEAAMEFDKKDVKL